MVYEKFTSRGVCGRAAAGRRGIGMERAVFERMAEQDQKHWWFVARRRILDTLIRRA